MRLHHGLRRRALAWPVPAAITLLTLAGFVVTIERVPIPWTDEIIYASIARAVQLTGTGAPTVLDGAPAIDHIGFYGPVFFELAARLFDVFGFSAATFRSIGIAGAVLMAASGAALVRWLGGSRRRQWWTAAILLLTPEVGRGATDGRMDTLAVGLSMAALAAYARGLVGHTRPLMWGTAAGLLLSGAMLTVPRSYPFVAAFMLATLVVPLAMDCAQPARSKPARPGPALPKQALRQWIATALVVTIAAMVWAQLSHGGLPAWLRFHWYIASHDDIEIAVAAGAFRRWSFTPWQTLTSVAAAAGLGIVAFWRGRVGPSGVGPFRVAGAVTLMVAAINAVLSAGIMNLTLALSVYFAVPLLAAVLATLPSLERPGRMPAVVAMLIAAFIAAETTVRLTRYARVAATWPARDPGPIAQFVAAHVPPGSAVWGPDYYFLYAVEQAGSRYLDASRASGADWARLVPQQAPARAIDAAAVRFLLWLPSDELPMLCPGSRVVARFDVAPDRRALLGPLGQLANALPDTYQGTELWRLPAGCVVTGL